MAEKDITVEEVEQEHLREVNPGRHAVYILAVIALGFVFMLVLIALLGSAAS
jgi:hypothetical protein